MGDVIELGQFSGEVRRVGVRSSTVRTGQGADVSVPNGNFISAEVVNWTGSDRSRRVDIVLGVASGTEPGRVVELLLATAKSCTAVAAEPEPVALFTGSTSGCGQCRVGSGRPCNLGPIQAGFPRCFNATLMDAPTPRRSRWSLWICGAMLVIIGAVALFTWTTLSFAYANGERVGYLQKFSRKGWVCKTWEGELAMQTMPGIVPEKFYFTARSEPVAGRVNAVLGKRVRVRYAQHKLVPSTCFGDTEYFVGDVEPIE